MKILALTDTYKKGRGYIELNDGNIFIYSSVNDNHRARTGVVYLVKKEWKVNSARRNFMNFCKDD